jgi:type II secretory pathway component PulC
VIPLAAMPAAVPVLLADSDTGKGSPIGLLVVLLLIVAVYFLYRSMNRHLRNVPGRFDKQQPPDEPERGPEPPEEQQQ